MSWRYPLNPAIDLHVPGRVSAQDAGRQTVTARAILERLASQPGVILADEVGMGKTFVALAVAASVGLEASRRIGPVVVMAPPAVLAKWQRDAELFRERCLDRSRAARFRIGVAERPVAFFKYLDDAPAERCALVLASHGLLTRRVRDPFTRLALVRQALLWSRDGALRRAVARHAPALLRCGHLKLPEAVWLQLLETPPARWLRVLERAGYPPTDGDDPVPAAVIEVLRDLDLDPLRAALEELPRRRSGRFHERMAEARQALSDAMAEVWTACLGRMRLHLPLLVLDEAHHLRNPGTRLASLLHSPEAEEDAETVERGALAGVFERMLFLTATPFQLGHEELCRVLERFAGVRWRGRRAPAGDAAAHRAQVARLRERLDVARRAALGLEEAWGRLRPEEAGRRQEETWEAWWARVRQAPPQGREGAPLREVLERYEALSDRLRQAEDELRPWVIRHMRAPTLPGTCVPRRRRLAGRELVPEPDGTGDGEAPGLPLDGASLAPFLLAARLVALTPRSRPVFAEGLASSYEAFLDTRRGARGARHRVIDDDEVEAPRLDGRAQWYLECIERAVRATPSGAGDAHPKVRPVTDLAMALWERGEKVLVFCHFVATGRALRQHLSTRMRERVQQRAARMMGCSPGEAEQALARLGERFDPGAPARRAVSEAVDDILAGFAPLAAHRDRIEEIVVRFLRTPTFLVRYVDLSREFGPQAVEEAFRRRDASGLTLRELVEGFCGFLAERCGSDERVAYLDALDAIQTGSHVGGDVVASLHDDELAGVEGGQLVANVRLVNGATKRETRQRLMLAFNTPFYPEVLIASSVMAEGVDLQASCRHVIHHDLSWNPSDLEQRTGRVDRVGSKAERSGRPIHVYLPYVAATQDEKMYRVVTDRARWFDVTMGGPMRPPTALEADAVAERVPFPEPAARELAVDLSVWAPSGEQGAITESGV